MPGWPDAPHATPLARRCRSRRLLGLHPGRPARWRAWRAWGPNDGVRADAGSPSAQLPSSASPSPAGSGLDRRAVAGRRADPRPDQHGVPGHHDVPRQRDAGLLRRGAGPEASGDPLELPGRAAALCSTSADAAGSRVWCGTGWTGQPNVIVHEDGSDRDPRGRLRRALPLPERPNGATDAARPGDGRPGEGLGDLGPRGLPAVLRGLARQPVPHHRDGPIATRPCSGR